jgi:hypothetical protein
LVEEPGQPKPTKVLAGVIVLLLLTTAAIAVCIALMIWIVPPDASLQERKGLVAISLAPMLPVFWIWKRFLSPLMSNGKPNGSADKGQ